MSAIDEELARRIVALTDEELAKMVFVESDRYREEALELGRNEAMRRNLSASSIAPELSQASAKGSDPPVIPRIDARGLLPLWPGFAVAALSTGTEFALGFSGVESAALALLPFAVTLLGAIYWFACIHELHVVLRKTTDRRYPVSPLRAVAFHFIPLFNIFWIFDWPYRLATFLRRQPGVRSMSGILPGMGFLFGSVVRVIVDPGLGLAILFATFAYLHRKVRSAAGETAARLDDSADWSSRAEIGS